VHFYGENSYEQKFEVVLKVVEYGYGRKSAESLTVRD